MGINSCIYLQKVQDTNTFSGYTTKSPTTHHHPLPHWQIQLPSHTTPPIQKKLWQELQKQQPFGSCARRVTGEGGGSGQWLLKLVISANIKK